MSDPAAPQATDPQATGEAEVSETAAITPPTNAAAAALIRVSQRSPMLLGAAALAIVLTAGGIGAAIAQGSSDLRPPTAPPPPQVPVVTPSSIPNRTPGAAVRPTPITRPPNSPRPTTGIPVQPVPAPSPTPTQPALPPTPSAPSPGGLPSDLPGIPGQPQAQPEPAPQPVPQPPELPSTPEVPDPGGLPTDPGVAPPALPTTPSPGPDPAGTGAPDRRPNSEPTQPAEGRTELAPGVGVTSPPGWKVVDRREGSVVLARNGAAAELYVLKDIRNGAETIVADVGRSYLPKSVANLQVSEPQIAQGPTGDVLSFASSSFKGLLTTNQGSTEIEGAVFAFVRQDRSAVLLIGMYTAGDGERTMKEFGAMLGSILGGR